MNKTLLAAALAAVARAQFNKTDTDTMTTQDNNQEAREGGDLHRAIMNLPCKAGRAISMNGASLQAYKEGHRDARHAAAELVSASQPQAGAAVPSDVLAGYQKWMHDSSASPHNDDRRHPFDAFKAGAEWAGKADTGASGEGEVKAWQERMDEHEARYGRSTAQGALHFAKEEIADLRAQLASLNGQLAQCVAESAKWAAAAGAANAQLARLQAPVGESIDTPEFRELLTSFGHNWTNGDEQQSASRATLIAHIDAQLARQHQVSQTMQGMADCMDMVRQELIEAGVIDKSIPPMMIANAVVEHVARQHQDSKPTDLSKRLRVLSNPTSPFDAQTVSRTVLIEAADEIERLAAAQGEPVAWITFRTKDGRETLKEGCVATNRAYTEVHDTWVWEPLGRIAAPPAAQAVPGDEVRDSERLYPARPRGIGLERTPGCMCCGGKEGLHNNISFFVPSRETGEAIVSLFKTGAFLDWREHEPNWIQVKVGACDAHIENLRAIFDAVRNGPQQDGKTCISLAIINAAIALRATKTEGEEQQ